MMMFFGGIYMVYAGTKDGMTYGFYLDADGLQNVFELTNEEHMALMDGQSAGKMITFHADGKPTLEDPPAPTTEELAESARSKRDSLIEDVSWRIERYQTQRDLGIPTTDSAETYTQILQYVQDLRDIPSQSGFPANIAWPTIPA